MPITFMPNALPSMARWLPMRPMPTTSMVLAPSSSSRCVRSPIMPRQNFLCWLSRASGRRRATARISAIACSATATALTPAALASRTFFAASCSLEYWSMPELIDWMNLSLAADGDEVVLPHARDHDDIGLADPLLADRRRPRPGSSGCRFCANRSAPASGRRRARNRWSDPAWPETWYSPQNDTTPYIRNDPAGRAADRRSWVGRSPARPPACP